MARRRDPQIGEAERALSRARALAANNDTVVRTHEAYKRLAAAAE